jgi:hypothetical protein
MSGACRGLAAPFMTTREMSWHSETPREFAAPYLQQGEPVQAVIGAQTASQWLAALTGVFPFLGFNRFRILAVTPTRIVVLDAGKSSMKRLAEWSPSCRGRPGLAPAPVCGTGFRPGPKRCGCTAGSSRTLTPLTAAWPARRD